MSNLTVEAISDMMEKTVICPNGVSFEGQTLVLDKEEDCTLIVDAISKCENLQFLNLEGNTLSIEAAKAIAKALESKPELKRALWKNIFTSRTKDEIPSALRHLGSGLTLAGARLTELDMSDNAFGPIGVEGLAGLLNSPTCYQLQELKLNNNGLGISGGKMIARTLLNCYESSSKEGKPLALKVFIAGRNRLENEGAAAIAKVFKTLGSLEEVHLPQNGIYPVGIKALSKSFVNNKNLKIINLNDNTLRKTGAVSIATALPHLQKLKVLNLGDCLLKTEGAKILAESLEKRHNDLEELYMGFNEIKKVGGIAIAKAVKNKNQLKILSLSGNNFRNDGWESVKNILKENDRISCLQALSEDDDSDDDGGSSDDGTESEHDDSESNNDISSELSDLSPNSASLTSTPKPEKNDTVRLTYSFRDLVLDQNFDSLKEFLSCPVVDNFKGIDKKLVTDYIDMAKVSSKDAYRDILIELLMKISQFSNSEDDIKTVALDISEDLYKNLFCWASDQNQLATVNNSLMVHLGLIKCEDRNFKINWSTEGCFSALDDAISKGLVPTSTEQILNCCKNIEKKRKDGSE